MDPRNGHVETIGALGARKSEIVTILQSLNKQFEAAVTIHEKSRIRDQWWSTVRMLKAVNLKIRESDEQRAIDMYLKAYSPTNRPTMNPHFPNAFEALQNARKSLWRFLMSLYPQFEVAPTMMEKSALISDMKTGMLMLGAVMYKIKEYEANGTAADHNGDSVNGDQQEANATIATMNLDESPAVAAPANFSASAALPNGHLSTTSSDAEPEPERSVDTNVQSDLNMLPPPAGDTATTSHNTGVNGAPANASALAPLSNDHLSISFSDVESEPKASVDTSVSSDLNTLPSSAGTNVRLDLITLPPPASDSGITSYNMGMNGAMAVGNDRVVDSLPPPADATATTSHNNGRNGALGVRIDRMLNSLARLAEVVRNA